METEIEKGWTLKKESIMLVNVKTSRFEFKFEKETKTVVVVVVMMGVV